MDDDYQTGRMCHFMNARAQSLHSDAFRDEGLGVLPVRQGRQGVRRVSEAVAMTAACLD